MKPKRERREQNLIGMASALTNEDLVVEGSFAGSDDLKEAKRGEKEVSGGIDVKEKGETEEGTKAEGDAKKNVVSDQEISSGASNVLEQKVSSNEQDLPPSTSTKKDREDETEEGKKGDSDEKSSSGDLGQESTNTD
ncbi:hypothetical protein Tsubulata_022344, partial [Turnera subulata]